MNNLIKNIEFDEEYENLENESIQLILLNSLLIFIIFLHTPNYFILGKFVVIESFCRPSDFILFTDMNNVVRACQLFVTRVYTPC